MIIGTFSPIPIGTIKHRLTDQHGIEQKITFKVMREATHDEYLKYIAEWTGSPVSPEIIEASKGGYYYLVSPD